MNALIQIAVLPLAAAWSMAGAETPAKVRPQWMAGRWAWVNPADSLQPGECPHSELYKLNGQVTDDLGEVSRWWIEGDYLVRVLVTPMEGEPASKGGRTSRVKFSRTPAGDLIFKGEDWAQKMVRCAGQ